MPRRRGRGGRCTSLHESTSVSPPLLISLYSIPLSIFLLAILAHCTDCMIYITLHYPLTHKHKYSIFALSKHTHTHKRKTTIMHYPSSQAQEHYIICTIHTSSTRSLSPWTPTLSKSLHSVSGNTLCEYVHPMCMY